MTLRDYFAAAAMQGLIAKGALTYFREKDVAFTAFEMAQAMLEEREP